jgi:glycosyltransferase involved in cell wall biosynthesis
VPPDAPGVLADAARRLLANPGLANTLGRQGRERVLNDANWDHVADRLFETLSS